MHGPRMATIPNKRWRESLWAACAYMVPVRWCDDKIISYKRGQCSVQGCMRACMPGV